jgi:type IV secretion system protein VirD4
MTDDEAAGNFTRPMNQEDIFTKDCPSQMADLVTINQNGKVTGILDEGDEYA